MYNNFEENTFPKLLLIANAAKTFIAESPSHDLEAWRKGIEDKSFGVEEGRLYYRSHPVISLVREWVLRDPYCCKIPYNTIKNAIETWEMQTTEPKKWDDLTGIVRGSYSQKLRSGGRRISFFDAEEWYEGS